MEKIKVLNTWKSTKKKKIYYELDLPIYKNKDWAIYKQSDVSYIYAFKTLAVSNLAGLNKQHLDNLAEKKRPNRSFNQIQFLYDRALESLKTGMLIIK